MSLVSDDAQKSLLDRWQQLHFQNCQVQDGDPSKRWSRADALRGLLSQVEYVCKTGILSPEASAVVFRDQMDAYSELVDEPAEKNGLNSYADAALTLVSNCPNESSQWKSGLTMDMDCVQNLIKKSQAYKVTPVTDRRKKEVVKSNKISSSANPSRNTDHHKPSTSGSNTVTLPQSNRNISDREIAARPVNNCKISATENTSNRGMERTASKWDEFSVNDNKGNNSAGIFKRDGGMDTANHSSERSGRNQQNTGQGSSGQGSFWSLCQDRPSADQPGCAQRGRGSASNVTSSGGGGGVRQGRGVDEGNYRGKGFYGSRVTERNRNSKNNADDGDESDMVDEKNPVVKNCFRTARDELELANQRKFGGGGRSGNQGAEEPPPSPPMNYGTNKKSLGARRGLNGKFVPPVLNKDSAGNEGRSQSDGGMSFGEGGKNDKTPTDPRYKNIEPRMIELITSEIMDNGPPVTWECIAGLEFVKKTIKEIVVWPMLRPDIFKGLRGPPKGLLLFGPPGTGKTLIGKCIASQSRSTFFSISASSLTSKWVGEGEKMVRALFAVARVEQPSVIFIDEIDSLLSQRSDGEHEATRRIKTEFLVQMDGATTGDEDRILVVGATNRPQEIDEAARRRFVKRLYVPLPESEARLELMTLLLSKERHSLTTQQTHLLCAQTDGYSGADIANLCREAALGPIRSLGSAFFEIANADAEQVRPISSEDFQDALRQVRASVSTKDLAGYIDWNKQFGSWSL